MVTLFFPFDFSWNSPVTNVHKEVVLRLDQKDFLVYSLRTKKTQMSLPTNYQLIELPLWKSRIAPLHAAMLLGKGICTLPRVASISMDVMHAVAYPQALVFRNLKRVLNPDCRLVVSIHGVPIDSLIAYYTGKVLSKEANMVTTISKFCAKHVKELYGVDSRVIYNGVDTDFFRPSPKDNRRLRVLYVGRLIKLKRPEWVARLAKIFPDCDFIIQGVGPMETDLKRISKKLTNLKVNASYLPHEKIRELYAKSDIFLFPSTDAFGLVALEAMACGLPLLLCSFGGQSELIQDGKEGLLADTFEGMEENLRYLVKDSEARRKMGRNARERSLEFRWEKIAEQYAKLYYELMS